MEEAFLWFEVAVCVDQLHISAAEKKTKYKSKGSLCTQQSSSHHRLIFPKATTPWYALVDELVAYFAGKEDVWAQAQFVTEALVAHSLPEVPQAEDGAESHEAVGVVSRFGRHCFASAPAPR